MHHKTFLLPCLMFLLLIISWAFSSELKAKTNQEPSIKTEEPESYFQKADEFFLKKYFKTAASEIRKGAGFNFRCGIYESVLAFFSSSYPFMPTQIH